VSSYSVGVVAALAGGASLDALREMPPWFRRLPDPPHLLSIDPETIAKVVGMFKAVCARRCELRSAWT
jgi:hypothetical protein